MSDLQKAWDERCKLRAEGDKLRAKGDKLRAEGYKLRAEGYKLWAESNLLFVNTIVEKHGPEVVVEWTDTGVIVNGEEFTYDMGGKDE